MDHIGSTNIRANNQVNEVFYNTLKFNRNSSLAIPIRDQKTVVTISLIGDKNSRKKGTYRITCLWKIIVSKIIIKGNTVTLTRNNLCLTQ